MKAQKRRQEGRDWSIESDSFKDAELSHENKIPLFPAEVVTQELAAVFVIVAVDAEVFPIGAILGIIPGIPILVVHR